MTVVVMAGGLSERFPPNKTVEPMADLDQTFLDYTLFDAFLLGFEHIIFVANPQNMHILKERIGKHLPIQITVDYVLQTNETALPMGISYPKYRSHPCGTGHALLCAAPYLKWDEPFLVINASVFYGRLNLYRITEYMTQTLKTRDRAYTFSVIGYYLEDCLSYSKKPITATVFEPENGYVKWIHDYEISRAPDAKEKILCESEKGTYMLPPSLCATNGLFYLTTAIFPYLERGYERFLRDLDSNIISGEYPISAAIQDMIEDNACKVKCFFTPEPAYALHHPREKTLTRRYFGFERRAVPYPGRLWNFPKDLHYDVTWPVAIPLEDLPPRPVTAKRVEKK